MKGLEQETFGRWVRFVLERQRVRLRREAGEKPPWTEDPIISAHRFTNIYREQDPGTTFARDRILLAPAPPEEVMFNLMVYRLIGKEETWARVGWITPWAFDMEAFAQTIVRIEEEGGVPWSNAYMVNSYHWTGHRRKPWGVGQVLEWASNEWDAVWADLQQAVAAQNRQAAHARLHAVRGWGGFLAFQALVDASYPRPDALLDWPDHSRALLPFPDGNDGYAFAGSGALTGLKHLAPGATQQRVNALADELQELLNEALAAHGFEFPRNAQGEPIPVSKANVMNCLCEFHKYERLRTGKAGPPKYFDARRSYLADLEARGHGYQYDLERDADVLAADG